MIDFYKVAQSNTMTFIFSDSQNKTDYMYTEKIKHVINIFAFICMFSLTRSPRGNRARHNNLNRNSVKYESTVMIN